MKLVSILHVNTMRDTLKKKVDTYLPIYTNLTSVKTNTLRA